MGRNLRNQLSKVNVRENAIKAMNQGQILMDRNEADDHLNAMAAYSKAIALLGTIANNTQDINSLGAAYLNRGQLKHRQFGVENKDDTLADFQAAEDILEPHSKKQAETWIRRNYCGALVNHANLLLDLDELASAVQKGSQVLDSINEYELHNSVDAQISLIARRVICDAIGHLLPSLPHKLQTEYADNACKYTKDALVIIQNLRQPNSPEPYPELSMSFYRFGARLHSAQQPEQLEDFLSQHLKTLSDPQLEAHFQDVISEML